MFHRPCYCAAQLVTGTSKRKQNIETEWIAHSVKPKRRDLKNPLCNRRDFDTAILACMCLKYKKSSPRCAITFRSGSRFRSWVNLSCIRKRENDISQTALCLASDLIVGTEVTKKTCPRLRDCTLDAGFTQPTPNRLGQLCIGLDRHRRPKPLKAADIYTRRVLRSTVKDRSWWKKTVWIRSLLNRAVLTDNGSIW